MSTETVSLKKAKATAQGANGQAKKAKNAKKSKTDAKNREAIKGSIRKEKDLMYKYIDKEGNHVADEDKKAYRAAARAARQPGGAGRRPDPGPEPLGPRRGGDCRHAIAPGGGPRRRSGRG